MNHGLMVENTIIGKIFVYFRNIIVKWGENR